MCDRHQEGGKKNSANITIGVIVRRGEKKVNIYNKDPKTLKSTGPGGGEQKDKPIFTINAGRRSFS